MVQQKANGVDSKHNSVWPAGKIFDKVPQRTKEQLCVVLKNVPYSWTKAQLQQHIQHQCSAFISANPAAAAGCKAPVIAHIEMKPLVPVATVCCNDRENRQIFDRMRTITTDGNKPDMLVQEFLSDAERKALNQAALQPTSATPSSSVAFPPSQSVASDAVSWPPGTTFNQVPAQIRQRLAVFLDRVPNYWSKDDVHTLVVTHCADFIKTTPAVAQSCKVPEIAEVYRPSFGPYATLCCKDDESRRIFHHIKYIRTPDGRQIRVMPFVPRDGDDRKWAPTASTASLPLLSTLKTASEAANFFSAVIHPLMRLAEADKDKVPVVALHEHAGRLAIGAWTEIDTFKPDEPSTPSQVSRDPSASLDDLPGQAATAGQQTGVFSVEWWSRVLGQPSNAMWQKKGGQDASTNGAQPAAESSDVDDSGETPDDVADTQEEDILRALCQIIDQRGGRSAFTDGLQMLAQLPVFRERFVMPAVRFGWIASAGSKPELRKLYERLRKLIRRRADVFEVQAIGNAPAANFKIKLAQGADRYLSSVRVRGGSTVATASGGVGSPPVATVAVLELEGMGCEQAQELLKGLLTSPYVLKVAYNLPAIIKALELPAAEAPSSIRFCWDLQLAYDIVHLTPLASLNDILTWRRDTRPPAISTEPSSKESEAVVSGFLRAVDELAAMTSPEEMRLIGQASDRRLARMVVEDGGASATAGETQVGFAPQTYQMRSIEVLDVTSAGTSVPSTVPSTVPASQSENAGLKDWTDVDTLLDLVHEDFWEAGGILEATSNRNKGPTAAAASGSGGGSAPSTHHLYLVEIVLYIGQRPYAITRSTPKKRYLVPTQSSVVERKHLDFAVDKLGGTDNIGPDNRAILPGSLHRISAVRNKSEGRTVIGLTMRVGRAMKGNTDMIQDLLLSPERGVAAEDGLSVLFLGAPGCGKTTIIREASRVLTTGDLQVCIVDTSNEICGGGDELHPSVGEAIRLMVPCIRQQDSVMIEGVQNHTVDAARTIAQRKVRLLATAHGDFVSLSRNSELRGLLGGFETVTVGDALASRSSDGRKSKTERKGMPPFDTVVELQVGQFDEWRIILDVAKAVDARLQGKKYLVQVRRRCPSTGRVFVRWEETASDAGVFGSLT
ncbi:unnamed protein product [Vitrella brassicaformis CCMP3155]|uniref:AAA+ ATPase domain-containing protein n=1 Tax=Vitrella brassicaformis (strain CCMP3155) TaxID=1169540 RepID=A0A0G4GYR1_VITBC|nr:unnamed protein product [Vitrella brassicaformis CCMP3155]|eukprot:CEM36346.1 unnamed protein product [Vitrella brassicaformis CCMP3155]